MDTSAGVIGSSLEALTTRYRVLSHNLANANTTGFKKRRSMFALALAEKQASVGAAPAGSEIKEKSVIDFTQGALVRTGRPMDMAVSGKGFFVLETPDGQLYTRNGSFRTNSQGQLADFAGRTVAGDSGPIILPTGTTPAQVQVSREGQISANGLPLGKLRIVEFEDESALRPVGMCGFKANDDAEPIPAEKHSIQQGFCESSNVSVVEELVDLVSVTRLYEANLKSIGSQDDRMKHILEVAMG